MNVAKELPVTLAPSLTLAHPRVPSLHLSPTKAYGTTVFVEATTVAEGRGTTTPFTLLGAPFLGSSTTALAKRLNTEMRASGTRESDARFRAAFFEPTYSKYNFTDCGGVQWARGVDASFLGALQVLTSLRSLSVPPDSFQWDGSWFGHPGTELIDLYMGTPRVRLMLDAGESAASIAAVFEPDAAEFREARAAFLLY